MMTRAVSILVTLVAAGCYGSGGDDDGDGDALIDATQLACPQTGPGAPPGGCEEHVADVADCRPLSDFPACTEGMFWSWECCICQDDGTWTVQFTECLFPPTDGPPSDGCGAFDAMPSAGAALPHC